MSDTSNQEKIRFVDYYQTTVNAGTYEVTATLTAPDALLTAPDALRDAMSKPISATVKLHVAGPRFFLPPSDIHSVFPPENGAGDYNNILPHIVLNRRTLPWERLVDEKVKVGAQDDTDTAEAKATQNNELEQIPFLALLVFSDDEEANGDVTPPTAVTLADLLVQFNFKYDLEPGEKLTDKVSVIDIKPELLQQVIPTGEELKLLAHGREQTENGILQRAVIIANRLPAPPLRNNISSETSKIGDRNQKRRNIAHLVMLENCYDYTTQKFKFATNKSNPVRLICLKSWQFNCTTDKPTLKGRLLSNAFTFEPLCVPKLNTDKTSADSPFEKIRLMSYAALPYHLRWGDKAHTLYHGPLVASAASNVIIDIVDDNDAKKSPHAPASADGLVRILKNERIFDVSLAAAWQLGQMLMLRDQSVAMEYFSWRRRDAQLRAKEDTWAADGHLHLGDNSETGLTDLPKNVQDWCQKRLKLHGLPFEYIVPDARMLPENSLRIFRIHETWMQCLLSGALAVGRGGDADRIYEAEYRSTVYPTPARGCTGFLLRSPAVDEHPDLKVVAKEKETNSEVKEVRLERIAPGLLLGLYDGVFSKLQFSLPPIGLHFGLKENPNQLFSKDLKNPEGSENSKSIDSINMKTWVNAAENLGGSIIDVVELSLQMGKYLAPVTINASSFAFQMCEGTESVEFGTAE